MRRIRKNLEGKKIFVAIDKTSDVDDHYVANVIVGTLEVNNPGQIFLLTTEVLEAINH